MIDMYIHSSMYETVWPAVSFGMLKTLEAKLVYVSYV